MKALRVLALVTACWCDSEPYFGFGHPLSTYSPYIPYSVVNRGLTTNFPQNTQIYYGSQQAPGRVSTTSFVNNVEENQGRLSTTTFVKNAEENHQATKFSSSFQKFDAVEEQQVKRLTIPKQKKAKVKVDERKFVKEIVKKPIT